MNDEQIQHLKDRLVKGNRIFWIMDGLMQEIVSIGQKDGEPSEVGFSVSGNYIALYNVDTEDLWVAKPIFPKK